VVTHQHHQERPLPRRHAGRRLNRKLIHLHNAFLARRNSYE
jgi:hypothetical protein